MFVYVSVCVCVCMYLCVHMLVSLCSSVVLVSVLFLQWMMHARKLHRPLVSCVQCTPCQFRARLCTSDCSKSGLVGGLDRMHSLWPRLSMLIQCTL